MKIPNESREWTPGFGLRDQVRRPALPCERWPNRSCVRTDELMLFPLVSSRAVVQHGAQARWLLEPSDAARGDTSLRKQLFLVVSLVVASSPALADVTIDWVPVGNPGNAADDAANCRGSDCGSVDRAYSISKYLTTNAQYAEFLNTVDAGGSDTLALYNASMGSDPDNGGIDFVAGNASGSKYVVKAGFANKPVAYVSFWDVLRFANWLHNGQGSAGTETGAYTITLAGITNNTITRNPGATVFLPSENEWYKAAYFDGANYFDYPAGSDAQITCAMPGATPNTANCDPGGPLAVTDVGAYTGSASPYGTFDQGGNLWQWNEEIVYTAYRGIRGGSWGYTVSNTGASIPYEIEPTLEYEDVGFRVASPAPEPGPGLLGMTAVLGLALLRKRTAKAL